MTPSPAEPFRPRHILVGANAHEEITAALHRARPELALRGNRYLELTDADLAWADSYVGFKRPRTATMGGVRWVHCTGAGVDGWLFPDPLPDEILLTRTGESFGPMIAEWALARMLAFAQQLLDLERCQRAASWAPREVAMLRGTKGVIVGTGDVGSHVARLLSALGVELCGVSRSGHGDPALFTHTVTSERLAEVVRDAHWIVVTVPLTDTTRGLVGREVLSACRRAVLLNAGRGAVVDASLLPEALDAGWLAGAALDVFDVEPLPTDSPLWGDARVMISPHISGLTTVDGAIAGFLDTLAELESGARPSRLVDRARQY
jgi:D-2-hydroxyacid dehydrogenase (NADP+)